MCKKITAQLSSCCPYWVNVARPPFSCLNPYTVLIRFLDLIFPTFSREKDKGSFLLLICYLEDPSGGREWWEGIGKASLEVRHMHSWPHRTGSYAMLEREKNRLRARTNWWSPVILGYIWTLMRWKKLYFPELFPKEIVFRAGKIGMIRQKTEVM